MSTQVNNSTGGGENSHNVAIMSYNSTGWTDMKVNFVNILLQAHGILICGLQEHFILENNLYRINCFQNYEVFSIPAVKNNDVLHRGRPSGGLSIIYHQMLCKVATPLRVPNSSRVQGLKVNLSNSPLLIINSYFPNDPRTVDFDDSVLLQTLEDIKYLVNQVDENFTIIMMGDLNADMRRDTTFVNIVKQFFLEIGVESVWSSHPCDFTFYHERVQANRTIVSQSIIDHFCVSSHNMNMVMEATPLHIPDNRSYHDPIYLKLNTSLLFNPSLDTNKCDASKIHWNRATREQLAQYKSELSHLLNCVNIDAPALECTNVHCDSAEHKSAIDEMCENVFDSISTAVSNNIPRSNNKVFTGNPIPGWTDSVQEWKELSVFWKSVWISANRPLDNDLHRTMKYHRNQYHYAIRRAKKREDLLRKNKFILACLNHNVNDIFKDIRSLRKKNSEFSKVVDGRNKAEEIAEHFKDMYHQIYNTHGDHEELNRFVTYNCEKIHQSDVLILNKISPIAIKKTIMNFHNGKNDSYYEWRSNALKHAVDLLAEPLCDLLKSMIIHNHIPHVFLLCSLIPILKDNRGSRMSSSNYRLIAISSLLLKIFDHVILTLCGDNLVPSEHQFGFQKGKSTTLCTWTVNETINYFTNRGSSVFVCYMDLTKAFDCVKLSILFDKLSNKIPAILIRFLIASYVQQRCVVQWDSHMSSHFGISNGVRQGAVLSPVLFNWYINDIYEALQKTGFGCKIGRVYFGCFAYADDLALLAPSREALQGMINKCYEFFLNHGIKISTNQDVKKTKTKILTFGLKVNPSPLTLNGKELPFVDSWEHLGHVVHSDGNSAHDLNEKRRAIVGKIHSLYQELGQQDPSVLFTLLRSYVFHLYGCQLWDIFSKEANRLWATWHKTIKFAYNLPYATHRYLLNDLVPYDHIQKQVISRFIKFQKTVSRSDIPQVQILHNIQSKDYRSVYGRNSRQILRLSGASAIKDVNISNIIINPTPPGCEWRINLLKDVLSERLYGDFLSREESDLILTHLCVD